jgi:hypothetical protein
MAKSYVDKLKSKAFAIAKLEVEMTDNYQGKVFAITQKDGNEALCAVNVPTKDMTNLNFIKDIIETKEIINNFIQNILNDDMEIKGIVHTECMKREDVFCVSFIKVKMIKTENGYRAAPQEDLEHYAINYGETSVNEKGEMVKTKSKLVKYEFE